MHGLKVNSFTTKESSLRNDKNRMAEKR